MYRRRYQMLEELGEQNQQHCDRLGRSTVCRFTGPPNAQNFANRPRVLDPRSG
jgi:hypothetical protein